MAGRINPKYAGYISDGLPYSVHDKMAELLSLDLLWRQLVAAISNPRYVLRESEIEEIASKSLSLVERPAHAYLRKLGDRDMTVYDLCVALDHPQFERISLLIRADTTLRIVQDIPSSVTVATGGFIEIQCKADGFPFPRYTWFKGSTELLGQDKPMLHFQTKGAGESGEYTCRIHNLWMRPSDTIFTSTCSVTVVPVPVRHYSAPPPEGFIQPNHPPYPSGVTGSVPIPPNIIKQTMLECYQTTVGCPLQLECHAVGDQPLYYAWYKDSRPLHFSEPVLHINETKVSDNGTYNCVVTNGIGCEARGRKVHVMIHSQVVGAEPQIQKHPLDIVVTEGGSAVFDVEAIGLEPLMYQWFRNGKAIPGAIRKRYEVSNCDSEVHGEYVCKVSNEFVHDGVLSKGALLTTSPAGRQIPIYFAGDKTALLIGVGKVVGASKLYAPHNDLAVMQKCLEDLNFKVYSYLDLHHKQMLEMVRLYASRLGEKTYSVFYFSGHGFETNRCLYMVPSDARNGFGQVDCVCLEDVKCCIQEKNPMLNVIITDMCRDLRPSGPVSQRESRITAPVLQAQSGNTIELCATSSGGRAYEPEQNTGGLEPGGLVSKLSKYIHEAKPISEIFNIVKIEMHRDSDYRRQLPEIRADNLSRQLSLADALLSANSNADYRDKLQRSQELYNNMHKMDVTSPLFVKAPDGSRQLYRLDCRKKFTNVIWLRVIPMIPIRDVELRGAVGIDVAKYIRNPSVSNTTTASLPDQRPIFEFTLSHLELLNRDKSKPLRNLEFSLSVIAQTSETFVQIVDLGYSLAATPFLGKELYSWQREVQEHHGRQPEENDYTEARRDSLSSEDTSGCCH